MGAGQLRSKVTFQRQGAGAGDGAGNYGEAFADLAGATGIVADLEPVRAAEVVLAEGVQGRTAFEVKIRYTSTRAGITVGDRMVDARDASKVYNVKAPPANRDRRNKYLTILVELGGAAG